MIPNEVAMKLGELTHNVGEFKKRSIALESAVKKGGPGSGPHKGGGSSVKHPAEFKHKGETYYHTGKVGTHIKSGLPSAEYTRLDSEGNRIGDRMWRTSDGKVASNFALDVKKGGPGSGRYPAGSSHKENNAKLAIANQLHGIDHSDLSHAEKQMKQDIASGKSISDIGRRLSGIDHQDLTHAERKIKQIIDNHLTGSQRKAGPTDAS